MSKATWGLPGEKVHYRSTEQFVKSWSMGKGEFFRFSFTSFFQEEREDGEDFKKNQNKTEKKGGMKTKASFLHS